MGRKTKYTEVLVSEICDRIAGGESLVQICADPEMPSRITVMRWLSSGDYDDFVTQYARAREMQGDYMDDMILQTANACTSDTALADRIKIGAYQWRASKLSPKKYGDKLDLTSGNKPLAPFTGFSIADLTKDDE